MSKFNSVPNLQIMTKCPMCDSSYEKEDVRVINKKDGTISLYLSCKHCKSSVVMLLMLGAAGVTSVSIPTDIKEEDFDKMKDGDSIDSDDVLEMYKFLKNI